MYHRPFLNSKRLALQLTPLLDLLLIVIFAQYLEIEQKATVETEARTVQAARQQYLMDQSREQLRHTQEVLRNIQVFREQAEQQLAETRAQLDSLEQTQQETQTRLEEVARQRDRVLSAVQQALAGADERVTDLLKQLAETPETQRSLSPEQAQQLADDLSQADPRDLAVLLLAYEEIRKRCDIWELHLDNQGRYTLFDGTQRHVFRATTAEEFERRLFETYKSLPQPKSLVILLASFGEVRADLRQNMLLSLPTVIERMRRDASGLVRFEYALIGYLPEATTSP